MADTVKPYNASESKKEQVSTMFDKIAPYYDFLNRLLSLGIDTIWRKKALSLLKGQKLDRILDVATGTGDVAIEAARQLQVDHITGIDISKEMLEIGHQKIKKKNLTQKIKLLEGDSENIPFTDNTFDAITVAFGVRNFENLEKGLAEMRRVLKQDGQLVILEFSRPRIFPFKQLFNAYFKYILPLIGRLTSKDPRAYSYLYESVQKFPEGQKLLNILEKTGFKSNRCKRLSLGICSIYSSQK